LSLPANVFDVVTGKPLWHSLIGTLANAPET
jgi:hypothetical protein